MKAPKKNLFLCVQKHASRKHIIYGLLFNIYVLLLIITSVVNAVANEEVHNVIMGDGKATLHLPESWIDDVGEARSDGQVLLHMRWPGLTGYYDGHEHDYPKDLPAYNNMIRILLTLSDRINSLQDRYQRYLTIYPSLSPHYSVLGLEQWEQSSQSKEHFNRRGEIYDLTNKNGQVEIYLDCDLPGMVPYPGCHAEFYVGPFLARVSYSRVFLPDWKAIQAETYTKIMSITY